MTVVSGAFDLLDASSVRQLHAASLLGPVELRLWRDAKFPLEERTYMWESNRYVDKVTSTDVQESLFEVAEEDLPEIPLADADEDLSVGKRPKVIVTGCFDWLHSGHVRFFEEASTYGELTVVVGSDRNVSLLKGPNHPMFSETIRRYLVASVRHVGRCLVSSGTGWMDAAPEIDRMKPDRYVVNEDGDKQEKRDFCKEHGIEYVVLKRVPAPGLPRRESTQLRGF